MKQALIIGAGISGITAARILAEHGFQVTVLEKRDHIGGNVYDYYRDGVLIHKYGPHLFHTNFLKVAEFVQRFAEFFPYEHKVLGEVEGKLVPIPFNFKSIDILFPPEKAKKLKQSLLEEYPNVSSVTIMELLKSGKKEIKELANYVYQYVFYGYTRKQWGKPPEEMDSSVMGRVPVRLSYDNRYFTDLFQKMPRFGYTELIKKMAGHNQISIRYSCDALKYLTIEQNNIYWDGELFQGPVIYTGCIEELKGKCFGELPYRSLHFELEDRPVAQVQPVVQINYPNRYSYTRTSEFTLIQPERKTDHTILVYEYPIPCTKEEIPYYPIETKENRELYEKYKQALAPIKNLYLLGRLAEYQYYNMDTTIKQAMDLAERLIGEETNGSSKREQGKEPN